MKPVEFARSVVHGLADPSGTRPPWCASAAVVLLALLAWTAWQGASHIMAPWDVFILLDGGWRLFDGQVPHRDFYNPIGSLTYILVFLGMKLGRPSLSAVAYGNALFAVVAVIWAAGVARHRLSGPFVFLFLVFVAFLSVAPRPLGYAVDNTTYAMIYNRFGYVLLSILLVQIFLPSRRDSPMGWWSGFSIGALLGLLFFCKITFCAFGGGAVALALLLRTIPLRTVPTQVAGFLTVCLGIFVLFHISTFAYLGDLMEAARAQSGTLRRIWLRDRLEENLPRIGIMAALLLAVVITPMRSRDSGLPLSRWKLVLIVGWILGSALAITAGNSDEGSDIPLYFVAVLILLQFVSLSWERSASGALSRGELNYLVGSILAVFLFLGPTLYKDARAVAGSAAWHLRQLPELESSQRFDSPALADFHIPSAANWRTAYWRAHDVPNRINDGIGLLRRHVASGQRVFSMTLANPFSFALQLTPPTGSPLWWDLGISFDEETVPEAEEMLNVVDFVILPVFHDADDGCCKETVLRMLEVYGGFVRERFTEVERSEYWILLERAVRNPGPQS